jgi:sugar/nucleoside kinase (ribokinase family)
MSGGLLQLSGVVVDFVHRIEHLPAPGEEVETSAFMMTAGGGFNAMVAARRMGSGVTYGGVLGQGPLADIALAALRAARITIATERRSPIDQGSCAVLVEANGERSFITHHGAERAVDIAHLESLPATAHDYALLTGYSLYKPASAAAFLAWLPTLPRPPRLVFDPGPTVADIPRETLERGMAQADWVSANAAEAHILTGEADPFAAAGRLAAGRMGAIVRRGADGCWLSSGGETLHIPGFSVGAIDTNGAGDAHDGVFIAAMIGGFAPADAALIANAAAAISTTIIGPATSPDATETRQFMEARGAKLAAPQNWERAQPGCKDAHEKEDRE